MIKKRIYHISGFSIIIALVCIGMVWADMDEIFNDRELALVRREVPSVFVTNVTENPAEVGTSLFDGDTLRTDEEGYALVLFMDQSVTRVRPESQLIIRGQVNRNRSSFTRIDITEGEVFMNVNREANSDVEVSTSQSVATVKGTEFGARSTGYFWVEQGEVEVTARESGEMATITDRMFAQVDLDGRGIQTGELTEDEINNLGRDYRILDSDLIDRTLRFRFMDENGQIREVELDYFEHDQ